MNTATLRRRTTFARLGLGALVALAALLAARSARAEVTLRVGQSKSRGIVQIVRPGQPTANLQAQGVRVRSANPGIVTARFSRGQLTITGVSPGRTSVTITGRIVTPGAGGRRRGGLSGGLRGGAGQPFSHVTQVRVVAAPTGGGTSTGGSGAGGGRVGGGTPGGQTGNVRVRVGQSRSKRLNGTNIRVQSANPAIAGGSYSGGRVVISGVSKGRTTVTITGTRIQVDGTLGAPRGSGRPPRIIRTPLNVTIQVEVVGAEAGGGSRNDGGGGTGGRRADRTGRIRFGDGRSQQLRLRSGEANTRRLLARNVQVSSANAGIATVSYASGRLTITGVQPGKTTVTVSGRLVKVDGELGRRPGSGRPPRIFYLPFRTVIQVEVVAGERRERENGRGEREETPRREREIERGRRR